jgi:VanZ family protein
MKIYNLDINGKYLLLSLVYMSFIFYLSSSPGSVTGKDTDFNRFIFNFLHIPLFGVLSLLLLYTLKGDVHPFEIRKRTYIMSFCLTILYAVFDEWHQSYVQGRMTSLSDICLDGIGGLVFLTAFALFRHKYK